MKVVYKYVLENRNPNEYGIDTLTIPISFRLLHAGIQNNQITIWIEVDPSDEKVTRRVQIVPTGKEIPSRMIYIGTVFQESFVWHIYMENE